MTRRPRGSGSVVREGSGWAIRFGPREAKRYEGGFRTKAEAERRLTLLRAEAMHRRIGIAADPKISPRLGELAIPWLERRKLTHKAAAEDGSRWRKHLQPWVGHLQPDAVDHARLRSFAEAKLQEGLASGTVRVCVALLSSLYVDLQERGLASGNPARNLPRSLARLVKPSHDPATTPFVERLDDVRRVFLALQEPISIAYALGAFAGLRPGEAFALRWAQVDLQARRIHVRESVTGSLKDKESRVVPILDPLQPVLQAWRLKNPGTGLVCPSLRCDGSKIDKGTRGKALRPVLQQLGLDVLAAHPKAWYCASRHTFASHWVLGGGSIEKLSKMLGHYSVVMTERYAHLRPDLFAEEAYGMLQVSLQPGSVAQISADPPRAPRASPRNH